MLFEGLRADNYDAEVIAKHRRTRTEEFLFAVLNAAHQRCVSNVIVVAIPAALKRVTITPT